jgi:hypothetical protein
MKKTATLYLCRGYSTSTEYIMPFETAGSETIGISKEMEIEFTPVHKDIEAEKAARLVHLNKIIADAEKEKELL